MITITRCPVWNRLCTNFRPTSELASTYKRKKLLEFFNILWKIEFRGKNCELGIGANFQTQIRRKQFAEVLVVRTSSDEHMTTTVMSPNISSKHGPEKFRQPAHS